MIDLKPCPFCGGDAKMIGEPDGGWFNAECQGCYSSGKAFFHPAGDAESAASAATAWNDRHAPAAKGLVWDDGIARGIDGTEYESVEMNDGWEAWVGDTLLYDPGNDGIHASDADAKAAAEAHHQAAAAELWKEWWG